jgi:ABC-type transporter Mla maintaining outer membrane lipid asymmetry ATPase subunit MlaF
MIQIRGLKKTLGGKKVLDGIDLDIPTGETVVVMGRSGTGKSVLPQTHHRASCFRMKARSRSTVTRSSA